MKNYYICILYREEKTKKNGKKKILNIKFAEKMEKVFEKGKSI
jgi:hypothetical protein